MSNTIGVTFDKVTVRDVSLSSFEETAYEPCDRGHEERNIYGELSKESILRCLTRRQQEVVKCLNEEGLTRKETALRLNISHQAVHQIVVRIRSRILDRGVYYT